jgi:hypothetical protein
MTTHLQQHSLDSVWRSSFSEFRDFINGIIDKSITIQEALNTYREVKCLPRKYVVGAVAVPFDDKERNTTTTVHDIAYHNKQIEDLFTALRKGMQPESLILPFKIKDREKRLIDQLAIQEG